MFKKAKSRVGVLLGRLGSEAQGREIARLRRQVKDSEPFDASRLIWQFGSGRTGSSWLATMVRSLEGLEHWGEPLAGNLFGDFYRSNNARVRADNPHFVLPANRKDLWRGAVRAFLLTSAATRYPNTWVYINAPNESAGAEVISEALPESRFVFLIRDPRDVISSFLAAHKKGGWLSRFHDQTDERPPSLADTDPDTFVAQQAQAFRRNVSLAKRAYDAHRGPKVFLRYEDLRTDTLVEMLRLFSELRLPVDKEQLGRAVEERSWENLKVSKGPDQFHRKAKPGGWREDLTPGQARKVEEITRPVLQEFYS